MPGNSFGQLFRITTFGESHGSAIGVTIDGCPAGLEIDTDKIQQELARRRPGQSAIVTQRKESDTCEIISGIYEGITTGTPLTILIRNRDAKPKDYDHLKDSYRPSHADYTYEAKYGLRDHRGGGRASARETAARVAAGAVARQLLDTIGINIVGFVSQIGDLSVEQLPNEISRDLIEQNEVRCPDPSLAKEMIALIKKIRKAGDTIGGAVECRITGVPPGLGEPVFDKLHADLGRAILSINACKGFEIGSGFRCIRMRGSEHNDIFTTEGGKVSTSTNYSGGIQGGISNGMDIYFRAAFKPVATLIADQKSIDREGNPVVVKGKGRHDPCVVPRAVPIVEAMAALTLADHLLRHRTSKLRDA
jgi:chorismate synthase